MLEEMWGSNTFFSHALKKDIEPAGLTQRGCPSLLCGANLLFLWDKSRDRIS